MITDLQIRNLKPKEKRYVKSVDAGGARFKGRLQIWVYPNGTKDFYYVYFASGKQKRIKVGRYESRVFGIAQANDAVRDYEAKTAEGIDVKAAAEAERLANEEAAARDAALEREARLERMGRGSLGQLLFCYVAMMRTSGKTSWDQVRKDLYRYVFKPHPDLTRLKACDVTDQHIVDLLSGMISRGVTTKSNRVRSYLHKAFDIGIKSERDPLMLARTTVKFKLNHNPVSMVARQESFERVGQRTLSEDEIALLWNTGDCHMGILPARALKLALATGLRAGHEILSLRWEWLDENERVFDIPTTKNKQSHIVPLNRHAMEVIEALKPISGKTPFLFPGGVSRLVFGEKPYRTDSLGQAVVSFVTATGIPHFAPRDIRRTVKTLMGRAGIEKLVRDKLMNHAMTDVSSKHYDRYDYLPEKRRAVMVWDNFLEKTLKPKGKVFAINIASS